MLFNSRIPCSSHAAKLTAGLFQRNVRPRLEEIPETQEEPREEEEAVATVPVEEELPAQELELAEPSFAEPSFVGDATFLDAPLSNADLNDANVSFQEDEVAVDVDVAVCCWDDV